MKLKDICLYLDTVIPVSFQESYDNSGLQVGDPENEITSVLLAFDITEDVMDEAISSGSNMIISHHPLIFIPLKRLTGKSYIERIIIKAIKNDITIYSAHTNLDTVKDGVSIKMARKLGLQNISVLSPLKDKLFKLVTYVPVSHFEKVRDAIFDAGAGVIGNYDRCSFSSPGTGSYKAGEGAKPFAGEKSKLHFESEIRFETIMLSHLKQKVINALIKTHPYEEVAYDIYSLENEYCEAGLGCTGDLPESMEEKDFLKMLALIFSAGGIRYSGLTCRRVKKVAFCGGSGISLLSDALNSKADVFVTSDIKYHDFFRTENRLLLVDLGHHESEKFSLEILYDLIIKKFPTFAVRFSETNTNPINYL